MNLLKVQDSLNKLPPVPESIQYLTAAAQGANPEVPPYMALARINEINKEMQTAKQVQPPAEPLNQSLPKQALQNMGIGALPQGQPVVTGSGAQLQTGFGGQVMSGGAPAAPQMPPQTPPNQMPQQGAQPVRMAADGGLMSLPVDDGMFEYGSGGVVAFNGEDGDQEVSEDADYDASASMRELAPYIKAALKQKAPSIPVPSDIEARLRKGNDYGIDEGPIGKGYLAGLGSLKEAKAAERAKQQADIALLKKMDAQRALADYSESSRGQTGLGGLSGLTRSYTNAAEKRMGQETALREDAIKTDSLINEAQYKMQELRNAKLKGDVAGEYKAQADMAKIAKDLGVSQNQLMARLVSGNLALLGREAAAGAQVDAAGIRAKAKNTGGPKAPSNEAAGVAINAARLREEHPDWSDAQINAEALRIYKQSAGAPNVEARATKDINEAWRKEKYTVDYIEAPDKEAYKRKWEAEWRRKNPDAAPAQAPKAGTAENPIKIK